MQNKLIPILAGLVLALGVTPLAAGVHDPADHEKEIVIALKTDEFELLDTDISHLAVGESEIIQTESGRVIDLLRTADGVEIYVDGELLDTSHDDMGSLHGDHVGIHKEIEIECEEGEECEHEIFMTDEGHVDMHSDAHTEKIIIIEKTAEETE